MTRFTTLVCSFLLLLSGCSADSEQKQLMSPDIVAKEFMVALFSDKDEMALAKLTTAVVFSQIKQYTLSQYPRIVLNMSLREPITVQTHGLSFSSGPIVDQPSEANVIVVVSSSPQHRAKTYIKLVSLIKEDDRWVVSNIVEPNFNTEARYGVESLKK